MAGDSEYLAARFEEKRGHLRAVARRMLGSADEAEHALREAWLRIDREEGADSGERYQVGGWLTSVVARVCLERLRARTHGRAPDAGPEREVLLADPVGLALLVVLEQLEPTERMSYVLHDMFGLPFEEIAPIVERSPDAARELAGRARWRVRGGAPAARPLPVVAACGAPAGQEEIVAAFLAAARDGSFEGLVAVLDPQVVLRVDRAETALGAGAVARQALTFQRLAPYARPALVGGVPGIVTVPPGGRAVAAMGFTVGDGRIVAMDVLADPARLARLDFTLSHTEE
ncbi:sigma factor-like helix-turn-helix DNA-binding protein [Streptomyces sp. NPDC057011]|uniref:sigma factor-like helix-turn-helix DNA-binding protein n=1 Tax=unclassified Streptomyces TaxID=2593676 RepID=UPI0036459F4B